MLARSVIIHFISVAYLEIMLRGFAKREEVKIGKNKRVNCHVAANRSNQSLAGAKNANSSHNGVV